MNNLSKGLYALVVAPLALLASPLVMAAPDATAAVAEIASWTATDGPIVAVGSAFLVAAAVAVGFKWIKGMIFG